MLPSPSPSLEPSVSLRPSLPYYEFWYPDWSSDSIACLNDGKEDDYMKASPSGYLFTSFEECCQNHFSWSATTCRRNSAGPRKWYPDFDPSVIGCKGDGLEPLYMKRYTDYLFNTERECCESCTCQELACFQREVSVKCVKTSSTHLFVS